MTTAHKLPRFCICIPSKGRPDNRTSRLLSEAGIKHIIFVEPQDYDAYYAQARKAGTLVHIAIVRLDLSDQGIGYARNFIVDLMHDWKVDWFWLLDDDITGLYHGDQVEPNKRLARKTPVSDVLCAAEHIIDLLPENVALATLEWREALWRYTYQEVVLSGHGAAAVCINVERCHPYNYDPTFRTLEDLEFSLKLWTHNRTVARLVRYGFAVLPSAQTPGGCMSDHFSATDRVTDAQRRVQILVDRYDDPDAHRLMPHLGKQGDQRVRVKWREFGAGRQYTLRDLITQPEQPQSAI